MLINNSRFILKGSVAQTQWEWTTFYISPDLETGKYIDTEGRQVPIVLQNNAYLERMLVKMEWWVATIIKRWLGKKIGEVSNIDMQYHWMPSTIWYITSLAHNQIDIDDDALVAKIKAWINFEWEVDFKNDVSFKTLSLPAFTSVESRDNIYSKPKNWDKCILIGTWEQIFSWWIWNTLGVSTPVPDASKTISWKIQIATEDEMIAGKDFWSSGAYIVAPLSMSSLKYLWSKTLTLNSFSNIYSIFTDIPALTNYIVVEYEFYISPSWEAIRWFQWIFNEWANYFRYAFVESPLLTSFLLSWTGNNIKYKLEKSNNYTSTISAYCTLHFYKI